MSVRVFYEILNQKGTPAMFTDTLANRPAFGYAGRLFVSTDSGQIFEDTGSAWTLVADAGVGGGTLSSVCLNGNTTATGIVITAGGLSTNSLTNTSLTTGSILFADGGGLISQSNATFFWDNTNKRLGIGNASPGAPLDIHGTGTQMQLNGTGSNNSYIQFQNAGVSKWRIGNTYNAGANSFDIYNNGLLTNALTISSTTNNITLTGALSVPTLSVTNVSTLNGNILLKKAGIGVTTPTYVSQFAISSGVGIGYSDGTGGANFIFQTGSIYDYTFPANTGTIALTSDLNAYLPLTGGTLTGTLFMNGTGSNNAYIEFQNASTSKWKIGNTYNASANSFDIFNSVLSTSALSISNSSDVITINYKLKSEAAILIKNGATVTAAGYTGISSTVSGLLINLGNSGNNATLTFQTGTDYTYTYPAATGTLALTSQLSGYLPLTGGTLTGALSGTSATFSSSVTADDNYNVAATKIYTGASGSYFFIGYSNETGSQSINFNSVTRGGGPYPLTFYSDQGWDFAATSGASRMRITSGGNVRVNSTTDINSRGVAFQVSGSEVAQFYGYGNGYGIGLFMCPNSAATGTHTAISFRSPANGDVGSITTTSSATLYNVSSDYRLKQDLKDYSGLNLISAIKTYDYEWKLDKTRMYGVLAHELSELIPYAVTGEKDGKEMQGVDYSKIVPILVKAIQELNEKLVRNNIN